MADVAREYLDSGETLRLMVNGLEETRPVLLGTLLISGGVVGLLIGFAVAGPGAGNIGTALGFVVGLAASIAAKALRSHSLAVTDDHIYVLRRSWTAARIEGLEAKHAISSIGVKSNWHIFTVKRDRKTLMRLFWWNAFAATGQRVPIRKLPWPPTTISVPAPK